MPMALRDLFLRRHGLFDGLERTDRFLELGSELEAGLEIAVRRVEALSRLQSDVGEGDVEVDAVVLFELREKPQRAVIFGC